MSQEWAKGTWPAVSHPSTFSQLRVSKILNSSSVQWKVEERGPIWCLQGVNSTASDTWESSVPEKPPLCICCVRLGVGQWDADADKLKAVLGWLCGTFCHWPSGVERGSKTGRMEYLLPLTWLITLSFPFQSWVQWAVQSRWKLHWHNLGWCRN